MINIEGFIEKLSSYNILNNLLPGIVFCNLLNIMMNINILEVNIVEKIFMYYFVGMIIGRIGSVIIEPTYKKIKLVKYAKYKEFLRASSKDDKIDILLETNNKYRTMVSMSFLLLMTKLYLFTVTKITCLSNYTTLIIIISFILLFTYSYRKQTKYIVDRVNYNNKDK